MVGHVDQFTTDCGCGEKKRVAFVGLGQMGSGIAANILRSGHSVIGFDIRREATDAFVQAGGMKAASITEAVEEVDILITSLPGPYELEEVAFASGVLKAECAGLTWIECSTIDVATGLRVRAACAERGITMIDAPLTGGVERARSGDLTALIGGEANAVANLDGLFACFATRRYYLGQSGAGYAAKLCQLHLNYLLIMGVGEALMLAARYPLDLGVLFAALQNSCAQSYVVDHHVPQLLAGDYDRSFKLGLAVKDIRLISELSEHVGVDLELGRFVEARYEEARSRYGDDAPHLSVVRIIEDRHRELIRNIEECRHESFSR